MCKNYIIGKSKAKKVCGKVRAKSFTSLIADLYLRYLANTKGEKSFSIFFSNFFFTGKHHVLKKSYQNSAHLLPTQKIKGLADNDKKERQ